MNVPLVFSQAKQGDRYSDMLRAAQMKNRGSIPARNNRLFYPNTTRSALGSTQSPIQWLPWEFSPEAKRPGREDNYSSPFIS